MFKTKVSKGKLIKVLRSENVDLWNRYRRFTNYNKIDLSGANLSKLNLLNVDIMNTDISSVDFFKTNLHGATLSNSTAILTSFKETNLSSITAHKVNFRMSIFTNTILHRAILYNSSFYQTFFTNVDLTRANLSKAIFYVSTFKNTSFSEAHLDGASFNSIRGKTIVYCPVTNYRNQFIYYIAEDDLISFGLYGGTLRDFIKYIKKEYSEDIVTYKKYKKIIDYLFWISRLGDDYVL